MQPSCPFHGVLPGSVQPLERVTLPVMFSAKANFHTEHLVFNVADIDLPYNTIIGRPDLNKFMAVAHYLTVKIPGPKGAITERADFSQVVAYLEDILAVEMMADPG